MVRFLISLIVLIAFVLAGTIFIKNASTQPTGAVFEASCDDGGVLEEPTVFVLPEFSQDYKDFKKDCREAEGTLTVCQCHTLFSFFDPE